MAKIILRRLAFSAIMMIGTASSVIARDTARLPEIIADPDVAAANPLPDFSYAGYGFGLVPIPVDPGTIINVTDHGAVAD